MTTNDATTFLARLSEYGATKFQDPLSELTRDRQKNLLVMSFLAIVLSSTAVSVTDIAVTGVGISVQSPDLVKVASGAIAFYLLVAYVLCLLQDFYRERYQTLVPAVNLQMTLTEDVQANQAQSTANSRQLREITIQQQSLWDEIEAINQKYPGDDTSLQRYQGHAKIYEELERLGQQATDLFKTRIEPAGRISTMTEKRLEEARQIQTTAQRLNGLRTVVEIVFPIGLALVAIWVSVVNTLVHVP